MRPTATSAPTIRTPPRIRAQKTFREAAESFVERGGDGRHLPRILDHLGNQMLRDIVPFDFELRALALFPEAKNSTRNRQAIAPALAVMRHDYKRGSCDFIRVQRFKEERPKGHVHVVRRLLAAEALKGESSAPRATNDQPNFSAIERSSTSCRD